MERFSPSASPSCPRRDKARRSTRPSACSRAIPRSSAAARASASARITAPRNTTARPAASARLRGMNAFPLRPREVFDELRKVVVGQDEAIREISVAIVKHLVGHPAPNILMIGNSGSGKTTLMRAVEQFLSGRAELNEYANVIRINANVLAEEHAGYGRAVLGRLFANAKSRLGSSAPL